MTDSHGAFREGWINKTRPLCSYYSIRNVRLTIKSHYQTVSKRYPTNCPHVSLCGGQHSVDILVRGLRPAGQLAPVIPAVRKPRSATSRALPVLP